MENPIEFKIKPSLCSDGYYIRLTGYMGKVKVFDATYAPNDDFTTEFKTKEEAQTYIDQHLTPKPVDKINPKHYGMQGISTHEKLIKIYGKEAVASHMRMSAAEYRDRAGYKEGQSIADDIGKAMNLEKLANELLNNC